MTCNCAFTLLALLAAIFFVGFSDATPIEGRILSSEESSSSSSSLEDSESIESEERLIGGNPAATGLADEPVDPPIRRRRDSTLLLEDPEYVYAKAEIFPNAALPRDQRKTSGSVLIRQRKSSQGVYRETEFKVNLQGLPATSLHGFHVHEFGTIGASCSQSGSHYNPFEQDHGPPSAQTDRHVGDLGNVRTDENGNVNLQFSDLKAKLYSLSTIVGRAFVVHAGMDDLGVHDDKGSKTTGNAGARVACGVIVWSDGVGWRGPQP